MSLEEYKKEIKKFLINKNNYTEENANKLIENYKEEIKEFLRKELSPAGAGTAMMQGY